MSYGEYSSAFVKDMLTKYRVAGNRYSQFSMLNFSFHVSMTRFAKKEENNGISKVVWSCFVSVHKKLIYWHLFEEQRSKSLTVKI